MDPKPAKREYWFKRAEEKIPGLRRTYVPTNFKGLMALAVFLFSSLYRPTMIGRFDELSYFIMIPCGIAFFSLCWWKTEKVNEP